MIGILGCESIDDTIVIVRLKIENDVSTRSVRIQEEIIKNAILRRTSTESPVDRMTPGKRLRSHFVCLGDFPIYLRNLLPCRNAVTRGGSRMWNTQQCVKKKIDPCMFRFKNGTSNGNRTYESKWILIGSFLASRLHCVVGLL